MSDPSISWEKPCDEDCIAQEIRDITVENIRIDDTGNNEPFVLSFPFGELDAFGLKTLAETQKLHSNNIGLHTTGNISEGGFTGTQELERRTVAMIADLLGASLNEVDGHFDLGATYANMSGIAIGRNRTPFFEKKNCQNPTAVLCSHLAHYSIPGAASHLGIGEATYIGNGNGNGVYVLGTDNDGCIRLDQIEKKIVQIIEHHPNISNFVIIGTVGTTMLGSVDDIPGINDVVGALKIRFPHKSFHFHVDAAHGGLLAPFTDRAPNIGFANKHLDSIAFDFHKMVMTEFGAGLILARKRNFDWLKTACDYVPGGISVLPGSRPGSMPASVYAILKKYGKEGMRNKVQNLMRLTNEVRARLSKLGFELFQSDLNIIGVKGEFPLSKKKYLVHDCSDLPCDLTRPLEKQRTQTVWNVVVMKHVQKSIDELEKDLNDENPKG